MKKLLFISLLAAMILPATELSAKKPKLPNPTEKTVTFDSQPQGARVIVNGKTLGVTPLTAVIPVTNIKGSDTFINEKGRAMYGGIETLINSTIKANTIEIKFVKEGYETGVEKYNPKVQINNAYDNRLQMIWPDGVFHEMKREENGSEADTYQKDKSIPAGEANKVVNRDRPGQTALERTIIRWYFESQPQGARIFWRVISSVPDQVKNTNENWLGNTPFEETRSFNIQGLTYENSRDVQIEIKVRRPGYIDQTKRFNVRQAIDQQEISSFFDMIKAED